MSVFSFADTARKSAVTMAAQGIRLVCQFGSIMVLSRILPPGDIGMVGLMASILAFLGLLGDFGLPSAIIQRETVSQGELNALFRVSVLLGSFLLVAVIITGFGASWVFHEPRLAGLGPYYGVLFLFQILMAVPTALLRRQLEFEKLAVRDIASNLIGTGVGIGCAVKGVGYFSIVWMQLATATSNLVLTWLASKWIPFGPSEPFKNIRSFLLFGGTFTAGEFANYLCHSADQVLIGKRWGMEQLGFYSRAYGLMLVPIGNLLGPIVTVLMPTMSRLRSKQEDYISLSKEIARGSAWLVAPLAAFVAASSQEITNLLLGKGWDQTAEILKWLALVLYAKPMGSAIYLILLTSGELTLMFRWVWANAALTVAAILIGLYFGTVGTAMAVGIAGAFLGVPLAAWFGARTKIFRVRDFLMPYAQGLLIGAVCFVAFQWLAQVGRSLQLLPVLQLTLIGLPVAGLVVAIFLRLRSAARMVSST